MGKGCNVMVYADFKDEADRMNAAMEEHGGITVHDRRDPENIKEFKAKPDKISKDPAEVVPHADVIIAALPSFAMANVCKGVKPHLKKGAILYMMPGQGGGDFVAKEILSDEIKNGTVTVAGIIPMPLNCRISEWGKRVELAALKSVYDLASVPSAKAPLAAAVLAKLLDRKVNVIGNFVGIHLHASNPNIHPGRLYGLWKNYKSGTVYPENPLFYETWDDESSKWVQAISDERTAVWKAICKQYPSAGEPNQVPAIKPYIESIYAGQIGDTSTLSKCFNTNDGFKGFKCPMKQEGGAWVPDFANRYFTEDIPEGLCMYKGIADLAGVKTPVIDEILAFFQPFMGKEYLKEGTLSGANVTETKSPQRYGKFTLKDLLAD